eukprot:1093567-Pyramimonas_sp.AAC.1
MPCDEPITRGEGRVCVGHALLEKRKVHASRISPLRAVPLRHPSVSLYRFGHALRDWRPREGSRRRWRQWVGA